LRKGFASLALHVQEVLRRDPLSVICFAFGRRGNLLIWHDAYPHELWTTRLLDMAPGAGA
jgi:transposase